MGAGKRAAADIHRYLMAGDGATWEGPRPAGA
jgi:hypothetical protein